MQQQNFEETIPALKEFLKQYNKITELCFNDCVHDFTSRKVLGAEDQCISNCVEKFLKLNQRISQRFQEHQLIINDNTTAQPAAPPVQQKQGFFK